ncbi:MAG TPA: LCP family protein [Candidatus Sulfotelmatobacter sp.]|nr:LCP family protein [Candidatus Sulfotelmatobacter sp.]
MSVDLSTAGKPPDGRRFPLLRRLLAFAVLFAVATAIGYAAIGARTGRWTSPLQAIVPDPVSLFHRDLLRVLVVGLDYDYDPLDQETSAHSRSDVIMAVGLDLVHHRIAELSVPRDMVATLPSGRRAKINAAQAEGGIKESQAVVASWLGVPSFDRYVVLRIDTTKDLIDALGGIDLDVENSLALRHAGRNGPIDYDDSWGHLHVHLKPGWQHLTGAQAIGYARFRHDWCSDPCRILRQQQVIRAILAKLRGDKLATLAHAAALLGVVRKDVETNLSAAEEISLANAFRDFTPAAFRSAQVPYTGDVDLPGEGDSIIPDEAAKARLVRQMLLTVPADPAPAAAAVKT